MLSNLAVTASVWSLLLFEGSMNLYQRGASPANNETIIFLSKTILKDFEKLEKWIGKACHAVQNH